MQNAEKIRDKRENVQNQPLLSLDKQYLKLMKTDLQYEEGQFFKFPLSLEGIQCFPSIIELQQTYKRLFHQAYGQSKVIKWSLYFIRMQGVKQHMKKYKQFRQVWKVKCKVCTNYITYGMREATKELRLISINYYHLHTTNLKKYVHTIKHHHRFTDIMLKMGIKGPRLHQGAASQDLLLHFLKGLPNNILRRTKFAIMEKQFGVSKPHFFELLKKLNEKYDIPFYELINQFERQNYQYRYLPTDLLSQTSSTAKSGSMHPELIRDKQNPNLPNLLLVVTPSMKQAYRQYGQWVGFDLTFSVISQRTQDNSEYMMGVFASTNHYRKIVIFGLVVTNSQSVYAYSYLISSFFEIMGSVPEVIITDEEKAIYYGIKSLKQKGIFTGVHLFDMFHVLRKFRKSGYEKQTFQLLRTLIHAKSRIEYRRILRKLLSTVTSDKEVAMLRNFDLNSDFYCYSQVPAKFVGHGVSNSVNQFFHSLIKNDIPYATSCIKAIQITLNLIRGRNQFANDPVITNRHYELYLHMPWMIPFRSRISERVYGYILYQFSQCPTYKILNANQQKATEFQSSKKERQYYYVQDHQGEIFRVQKYYYPNNILDRFNYKWICNCQMQSRAGLLCSHIAKIILKVDEDFLPNLHKRWFIDPAVVLKAISQQDKKLKLTGGFQKKILKEQVQQQLKELQGKISRIQAEKMISGDQTCVSDDFSVVHVGEESNMPVEVALDQNVDKVQINTKSLADSIKGKKVEGKQQPIYSIDIQDLSLSSEEPIDLETKQTKTNKVQNIKEKSKIVNKSKSKSKSKSKKKKRQSCNFVNQKWLYDTNAD